MCAISHKTLQLMAVSSHGNLFYAAVVVATHILPPTLFFFKFHKTTEFSPIKQFFKEVPVYMFLFVESNTAYGTSWLHLTDSCIIFKKATGSRPFFNRIFFFLVRGLSASL